MNTELEPLKNYVLVGLAGVQIRTVRVMAERFRYEPESRTLFLNGEMFHEEACAICEDLLAELMQQ